MPDPTCHLVLLRSLSVLIQPACHLWGGQKGIGGQKGGHKGISPISIDDTTSQLTSVTGTLNPPESYTYDLVGNCITSASGTNSGSYTTAAGNRLASGGQFTYTYDAEGNVTRKVRISGGQTTDYTLDHRNRLAAVEERTSAGVLMTSAAYTYDVFDRRIAKSTTQPPLVEPGPTHDLPGTNMAGQTTPIGRHRLVFSRRGAPIMPWIRGQ